MEELKSNVIMLLTAFGYMIGLLALISLSFFILIVVDIVISGSKKDDDDDSY